MLGYFTRRTLSNVVMVIAATFIASLLVSSNGLHIAFGILGPEANEVQAEALAEKLGLLRPPWQQYGDWLWNALHGDFGRSYFTGAAVADGLTTRVPVTLSVLVLSILIVAVCGTLLGVLAATRRGWVDRSFQVLSIAGHVIPDFIIGLFLVVLFGIQLRWLPATGYIRLEDSFSGWLSIIILPGIALAVSAIASVGQQVRGAMIDELAKDYVRTLRSRGIAGRAIVFRYALRSAAGPGLTVLGLEFIGLISGAVIIEKIFNLPGIGSYILTAGLQGDVPIIMGVVMVFVLIVLIVNVLIDVLNGALDSRKRQ